MSRFSVYRDPAERGYLLDVQADLLSHLNVRTVVPLLPLAEAPRPASRLNPVFTIDDRQYSMVTQYLASVPVKLLGQPLFSRSDRHDEIVEALDFLFQGF